MLGVVHLAFSFKGFLGNWRHGGASLLLIHHVCASSRGSFICLGYLINEKSKVKMEMRNRVAVQYVACEILGGVSSEHFHLNGLSSIVTKRGGQTDE